MKKESQSNNLCIIMRNMKFAYQMKNINPIPFN